MDKIMGEENIGASIGAVSKKKLAILLSMLEGVDGDRRYEHYQTDSEIAADWLWRAYMKGDIYGKKIADLGCGNGVLGIGALILGAKNCWFVDKSESYLDVVKKNIALIGKMLGEDMAERGLFLREDIAKVRVDADIIIMNPPFGTKIKHADRDFLIIAFRSGRIVYSMHKTETECFVRAISRDYRFDIADSWEYDFPIKAAYRGHKKPVRKIKVRVYRLIRKS